MKRLISLILVLIPFMASAQSQSLEFFYISHDRMTPVNDLCVRLTDVYNDALKYDDYAVIFYLPNGDTPLVVKVNLEGDNRGDFNKIIGELQSRLAHDIYTYVDLNVITDIFNTHDFITESGDPRFNSVLFCWYVNTDFWALGYNESLIAKLYFCLDLDKYHESGYITTEIWHAEGDGLEKFIDKQYPFGPKNLYRSFEGELLSY